MSINLYDLANELDRAIRQLPEYKAVLSAKEAIEADEDSKALLEEYLAFQTEIQATIQSGQMPSADLQEKMETMGERIQSNNLVNEFFAKQQHLSVYVADLEKIIFSPIRDLF